LENLPLELALTDDEVMHYASMLRDLSRCSCLVCKAFRRLRIHVAQMRVLFKDEIPRPQQELSPSWRLAGANDGVKDCPCG
jgi:hypothetical protein